MPWAILALSAEGRFATNRRPDFRLFRQKYPVLAGMPPAFA